MSKERDMTRIAVAANCSTRTVRRYMDGSRVLPVIEDAIKAAAKSLNIKLAKIRTHA
jgi:DNA-binding LacI/PurR family transcriptional regulator